VDNIKDKKRKTAAIFFFYPLICTTFATLFRECAAFRMETAAGCGSAYS